MKLAFAHGLGSMRICAYANLRDDGGRTKFRGGAGGQRSTREQREGGKLSLSLAKARVEKRALSL